MTATAISIAGYGAGPATASPIWIASYGGPPPASITATEAQIAGYGGLPASATAVRIIGYGPTPPGGTTAMWISGIQTAAGTAPASSTWSAADASATGMTLSNGGLTLTPAAPVNYVSDRISISKTSGKLYIEFSNTVAYTSGFMPIFGLADTTFNPTARLGIGGYSGGMVPQGNAYVTSGFTSNYSCSLTTPASGDVWALAVDFATGNVWLARNNVWSNSSNPATATLPGMTFVPATVGALFAGISLPGVNSGVWTLQPTAASQKYAPPSGFSAWG